MQKLWAPWRISYILNEKEDGCIFCNSLQVGDDRKGLILHRGRYILVMLNKYPYNNGHLMIAPKRHVKSLEDLGAEEMNDLISTIQRCVFLLKKVLSPHGFNIGANLGKVAGAGVEDHLHFHIVPRWEGDTNYMPVLAETRVIPEHLEDTYDRLYQVFKDF
ncbi:MAG: HIT domain-containing protein [Deltaproteobacteria bacterium]|nr:HIT domain-containing protein [Deltaproteobacteria bacterium]